MRRHYASVLLAITAMAAPSGAIAQTAEPSVGEVVMTQDGVLARPWKEVRACVSESHCDVAVLNARTYEVARYGERWSTKFEPTGKGKEVRRAETAMAKAIRLKGPAKP